jgi:DNA-binding NarL/FixJ family response regulator
VLAAGVDVFLAAGDASAARRASEALAQMAATIDAEWLRAMVASARGAVLHAEGDLSQALASLRHAMALWSDLDVPYEAARTGLLIARVCQALGDAEGARLEWETAVRRFRQFGAAPALQEAETLSDQLSAGGGSGTGRLSPREIEVLRLIARGKTNRTIARELEISEKTVARHVSNIFTKLDLSTRAAATAYAFTHGLAP